MSRLSAPTTGGAPVADRVQSERVQQHAEEAVEETARSVRASDYDAILDEIDSVLESDAEEYVRSFVQKGGQ
jgi:ubiquitin-like protein Pup